MRDCCLNCEKRYLGCHSKCEAYKEYKKVLDKIKENKKKYLEDEGMEIRRRTKKKWKR